MIGLKEQQILLSTCTVLYYPLIRTELYKCVLYTGAGELKCRVQVVGLVRQHLSAVLWFYHCGLLSSGSAEDTPEEQPGGVPFPADLLARIYHNRSVSITCW